MGDFIVNGNIGKCGTCGYEYKLEVCGAGLIWCPKCQHSCITDMTGYRGTWQ